MLLWHLLERTSSPARGWPKGGCQTPSPPHHDCVTRIVPREEMRSDDAVPHAPMAPPGAHIIPRARVSQRRVSDAIASPSRLCDENRSARRDEVGRRGPPCSYGTSWSAHHPPREGVPKAGVRRHRLSITTV